MKITSDQLKRLQTVYSQLCAHTVGYTNSRESRITWASLTLRQPIASFKELTRDQARILIDAAQGELGHRAPSKFPVRRPVRSAEDNRREGLDGRHDGDEFICAPQMVSGEKVAEIGRRAARLGMDEAKLKAWLSSRHSPLKGRSQIRTTADANKVLWALKGMLEAAGLWIDYEAA